MVLFLPPQDISQLAFSVYVSHIHPSLRSLYLEAFTMQKARINVVLVELSPYYYTNMLSILLTWYLQTINCYYCHISVELH